MLIVAAGIDCCCLAGEVAGGLCSRQSAAVRMADASLAVDRNGAEDLDAGVCLRGGRCSGDRPPTRHVRQPDALIGVGRGDRPPAALPRLRPVLPLSLAYHDRTKVGDSLYRIAYDTQAAMSLISGGLVPLVQSVLMLAGIVAVMLRIDGALVLVAAGMVPLFWAAIRWFGETDRGRAPAVITTTRVLSCHGAGGAVIDADAPGVHARAGYERPFQCPGREQPVDQPEAGAYAAAFRAASAWRWRQVPRWRCGSAPNVCSRAACRRATSWFSSPIWACSISR